MKLTVTGAELQRLAGRAAIIVHQRSWNANARAVLLEAGEAGLAVTATDLDRRLAFTALASVERPGATALPTDMLNRIANVTTEDDPVQIEQQPGAATAQIICGKAHWELPGLSPRAFPTWNLASGAKVIEIEAKALIGALADVAQATASREKNRPALAGVYLHAHDGGLHAVATDGNILLRDRLADAPAAFPPQGVLIPGRTVSALAELLVGAATPVQLFAGETALELVCASLRLASRQIDGTYPDYAHVIPQQFSRRLTVERGAFRDGLLCLGAIVAETAERHVRLDLRPGSCRMSAKYHHPLGERTRRIVEDEGESEIVADYDGEPCRCAFSLADIARAIPAGRGEIVLALNDDGPALVDDPAHPGRIALAMQRRC